MTTSPAWSIYRDDPVDHVLRVTTPQGESPTARCSIKSSAALRTGKRGPARVPTDQYEVIFSAQPWCDTPITLSIIPERAANLSKSMIDGTAILGDN